MSTEEIAVKKPTKYDTLQNQIDELLKEFGDLKAVSTVSSEVDNSEIETQITELSKKVDNVDNNFTSFKTMVVETVASLQKKVKQFENNEYYIQSQKDQGQKVSDFLEVGIEDEPRIEGGEPVDRNGNPLLRRGTKKIAENPVINMN